MLRYRVYSKNILCDGMTESEAKEVIMQLQDSQPSETFEVEDLEFITLPGWESSTVGVKEFNSLPKNTKTYIETIEKLTDTPIDIISTGPAREEIIQKKNILND